MIILGIDPGASGAIAALCSLPIQRERVSGIIKADSSYRDLCDFIVGVAGNGQPVHGYLERVSAGPGAGATGMFRFGQSFGALQMLLTAYHIPFDLVSPVKWQVAMGCARPSVPKGAPKESQTEHKNRTKNRAQQVFPDVQITHAIADALLIAEYGRRLRNGEL